MIVLSDHRLPAAGGDPTDMTVSSAAGRPSCWWDPPPPWKRCRSGRSSAHHLLNQPLKGVVRSIGVAHAHPTINPTG